MLGGWVIVPVTFAYLGLLFAVAYWGDKRADAGRSVITPTIYALSLAVYMTTWTFYGSVGRAASNGVGFLPIYLGPTVMAALWWLVLRKIIRISRVNRITSIADFIASRYGKSTLLGGLVTVIAVVGIIPYISLQLKAVSNTFTKVRHYPEVVMPARLDTEPFLADTGFYVALIMAAFAILFGTRHLEATERHEGMVTAIAFESIVKLVAFLAVGIFVTFGMFGGFGDLFGRAAGNPDLARLLTLDGAGGDYGSWLWLVVLSMLAILFLPRQFQVAVVENVDESHLRKAIWLFPLYMLAINVFVLPITFAGLITFPNGDVDADMFVLSLPIVEGQEALALLVFIGGLSAATAMIIVETVALSIMVSNDLVMPALLRSRRARLHDRADLSGLILGIRRGTIVLVLLLGYLYFRIAGEAYALVQIGLVSFAAVAQFAPAFLGGLFWKRGTKAGAVAGLTAGFAVWTYTLLLPSFARSGWLPATLLEDGPFGIGLLNPLALFGLTGLDDVTHAMIWTMLVNIGAYVGVSLSGPQSPAEHGQATLFVDVFEQSGEGPRFWRGSASVEDLRALVARFLGSARADEVVADFEERNGASGAADGRADAELMQHVETLLGGAIGASSARVVVGSVAEEEPLGLDEVMNILEETSQAIAYSRELERKSRELEEATAELRAANERLTELDRLKDDFVSTVTHELRTPLTSIRSFSEIVHDNPDLSVEERTEFLGIIVRESERLTRLINQVLDLSKIESGKAEWHIGEVDLGDAVHHAVRATSQLFDDAGVDISVDLPEEAPRVRADEDRLVQVMVNLLSNAAKFCDPENGRVAVRVAEQDGGARIDVADNGVGIDPGYQRTIFEKFGQVGDVLTGKPQGTGLGLPISRQIITHLGGQLWVSSEPGQGATFSFTLPREETAKGAGGG